ARSDGAKLDALLRSVQTGSAAIAGMLAELAERSGVLPGDAARGETPFSPFEAIPESDGIPFRFGDYSGQIDRDIYEDFVEEYKRHQDESGAVLIGDVLRGWLNV